MNHQCPQCGKALKRKALSPSQHYGIENDAGRCPYCDVSLLLNATFLEKHSITILFLIPIINALTYVTGHKPSFAIYVYVGLFVLWVIITAYNPIRQIEHWPRYIAFSHYPRASYPEPQSAEDEAIARNIANYKAAERYRKQNAKWWEVWK